LKKDGLHSPNEVTYIIVSEVSLLVLRYVRMCIGSLALKVLGSLASKACKVPWLSRLYDSYIYIYIQDSRPYWSCAISHNLSTWYQPKHIS
jgi:hypothetical protein